MSLNKVIYFSGSHGTGKSTLLRDLLKINPEFLKYNQHLDSKQEDTYDRMVFRIARYWIEAQELKRMSQENPDKLILLTRCIHDNFAYGIGFMERGWITPEQFAHHQKVVETMYGESDFPVNVVRMSPPVEWIRERLEERWAKGKVKWREKDQKYLTAINQTGFPEHYSSVKGNILTLTETDRQKRVEVVSQWIADTIKIS